MKANEALSLPEETNPEETDETMAVALNPYKCKVVIKRLNVPGASSSYWDKADLYDKIQEIRLEIMFAYFFFSIPLFSTTYVFLLTNNWRK